MQTIHSTLPPRLSQPKRRTGHQPHSLAPTRDQPGLLIRMLCLRPRGRLCIAQSRIWYAEESAQLQYQVGGHPTPIADIVTDCFPVVQKFQSFSYGPAAALLSAESPRQISLTRERTQPRMFKVPITVESSRSEAPIAVEERGHPAHAAADRVAQRD
jgi:hypothetical protein